MMGGPAELTWTHRTEIGIVCHIAVITVGLQRAFGPLIPHLPSIFVGYLSAMTIALFTLMMFLMLELTLFLVHSFTVRLTFRGTYIIHTAG